jgi:hypothetical protein
MRKIVGTGRVAEPAGWTEPADVPVPDAARAMRGSLQLRHVDAGSCNGCEIEIGSCFGPVYDGERFGVRLVASPRHADAMLVTGSSMSRPGTPTRVPSLAGRSFPAGRFEREMQDLFGVVPVGHHRPSHMNPAPGP